MKHTFKRIISLLIALLLATPTFAFVEAPEDQAIVIENVSDAVDQELSIENLDIELPVEEAGEILPGDPDGTVDQDLDISEDLTLDLGELIGDKLDAAISSPFDQTVTVGDATFTVTAGAGVFPDGAALRVRAEESDEVTRGVEAALGTEGVYNHRLYRVEVLDASDNIIMPDIEQGTPVLRVKGLNLPEDARVVRYDEAQGALFEIDAIIRADGNAIEFSLYDMTVYDILSIEPSPVEEEPTETLPEQPAEGEGEGEGEPIEQPGDGEGEGEPAEQPADGQEGEPDEQPDEGEEEAVRPFSVVFDTVPETAVVTVYAIQKPSPDGDPNARESVQWTDSSEDGSADLRDGGSATELTDEVSLSPEPKFAPIPAQEDGSFLLLPGEYVYSAEAEGYISVENIPFTVMDEPMTLSVVLEPSSPASLSEGGGAAAPEGVVPFDQSKTVDGVIVTVKADPGVFPTGAELSVKRVPVYRQRQAEAAIEDVREGDANVAVSYTFDIKVIDPVTDEEIQPAEGQTASVSFALEQVADENLTTSVYHVTEDETTGELTAESLDVSTETTPETGEETTAVVETDGFSLYTVEFTYNSLECVLPGDASVPMSEILAALGLTGEVTAVQISNESLFSASAETGEWVVTAHRAFSTSEWMKVTINGIVYQITVTDDQPAVAYIESGWDGSRVTSTWRACGDYTTLTSNSDSKVTLNGGWYVLNQNVTYSKCLSISGDTHLILCDNCTLYAEDGIYIQGSATLNVYGQSGTGWIWADLDDKSGPGIGGVNNTVGGNLVVHGGCIYAQGGTNAAGIGGGNHKSGMGDITVYNGRIHAYGGSSGAGIGRGQQNNSLGTLTIYSGTIHAFGGSFAAGIGGGEDRSGYDNLNIYGGTVKAEGGINGAGIGGGEDGDGGGTVNITGGTVTAKGGSDAAGIGGGFNRTGCRQVNITGGTVEASIRYNIDEDDGWAAIGAGHNKSDNGGLTVGDRMKVTAGRSASAATLQAASARVSGCRKYYAKLEHCDRHNSDADMYYTVTATTHTHICKYCNYRETDSHDANGAGGTCSKCGYDKNPTVQFDANLGSGTMDDVYVVQGSEYVLPECRFTAPDNQAFKTWSVQIGNGDKELKDPGEVITVTADTTVWAVWGITVNDVVTGGGTVSYERRVYLAGETVKLNVRADTGWALESLTATNALTGVDVPITNNTFIMEDANVTVTAVFTQIDYAINIDSTIAHGKVTADKITAHYRDEVNLTVTPDAGYSLSRLWATYGDGKEKDFSVEAPYSFKMRNCEVTVHATFVLKVTYDYDSGCGTLSGPSSANEAGETVTVTATPKENCGLRSLYYTEDTDANGVHHNLNITEAGGTYGITMPSSGIAVHGDFARKYTITCAEIENGTVSADHQAAYAGETITVTYTPSENDYQRYVLAEYDYSYYEFGRRKWGAYTAVDGGAKYQYTFTMPSSDVTVLGKFADFSTKATITVDFCAGHEALARSFNGLKSIPENSETCTVNGTLVTIPVAINPNDSENSVRKQAQIFAIAFIGGQLSGRNYMDAGEQMYDDYLGTKPLSEYQDIQEIKDEAWGEDAHGIYCLLWKKKLTEPVTVKFELLTAGTNIKKVYGSGSLLNHTDPQPAFTVNGPVTYETYNTSWYVSYDADADRLGNMAGEVTPITVQGGERYYTRIYLTPDFQHYIADPPNSIISVNSDVVTQAWYHCGNSGSASVVAEVPVSGKNDAGVSIAGGDRVAMYGDDVVFTATAANEGENGAWTWRSSDTTVAEIDSHGKVTTHKTGEVKITARYESKTTIGSATVKLYIVPRLVTITAKDASKPYDGTPLTQPEAEFDGLVGTDSFTVTMTPDSTVTEVGAQPNVIATVNGVDVATGTSSPVEGVEITTATIIGNYKVITAKGTLTVYPKSIAGALIIVDSPQVKYTGSAVTVNVRKVIVDGKVLSAEKDYVVSGNTGTEKSSDYELTVTGRGNYKDTATLKWGIYDEIIVAPAQDVEVTYDGKPHSIKVELDANLEGHGATVQYRGSEDENYSDDNPEFTEAGIHPVYYRVTCSPLPDYEGSAVVIINRATATVTAEAKSKTYGDVDPTLTAKVEGLVSGESEGLIKYTLSRAAGENVGSYTITPTGEATQGNYTVTYETGTLTVKRAAATVTADAKSKTYGDVDPALTATVTGLKNGDVASVVKYTLSRATGENVGSYAITPKGEMAQGNYSVTFKTGTLTVNRATATVTADAKSKTYGDTDPALTAKVEGLVNGESEGLIRYTLSRATGENVGSYTVTPTGEATQGNYTVTYRNGTLSISKAAVTVTADAKTKVEGTADPVLTYTATGLVNGDTLTGALTRDPGEAPGAYNITQGTLKASDNYDLTFQGAVLTITAKPSLPVKADYTLLARLRATGRGTLKLSWSKVKDADGYDIFFVKCGTGNRYELIATVVAPTRTYEITGLKNATTYRARVKAWKKVKGRKTYIGKASPSVHSITGGYTKKWCNAKAVTVKKTAITLAKGKSSTINATVTGAKKGRKVLRHVKLLRYYSGNTNVAKVNSSGKITAVGGGTCKIYVMANNGVKASVQVTVIAEPTKVAFKEANYSVKKGKKLSLAKQVKLSPSGVTSSLTWSSRDPTIATVSSKGVVKGVKKGTVTITVQTANGKKATTTVKVK